VVVQPLRTQLVVILTKFGHKLALRFGRDAARE